MGARAILAALPTVIKERHRAELYQSYVADCLQSISRNIAPIGRGDYIAKRWADISDPKPEETRTPEEIITQMKNKIASA
jgi:hypothetical protein|nr:MAG TPA: hypothetical protein [Caudoviricetes sp.]